MSTSKLAILSRYGPVSHIRFNQPESDNQLTVDMVWDIGQICATLNADNKTQVVIVRGSEGSFCRGGDQIPDRHRTSTHLLNTYKAASYIGGLKAPTIASINGNALNQGLELALACDIRLAAEDVSLGFPCISAGFMPWDGGTQRLPRIVGMNWAQDLLFTGRIISSNEAYNIGLINKVVSRAKLLQETQNIAELISQGAPTAIRYLKEAIYKGRDLPLEQGLTLEADLSFILHSTKDRVEGIKAFLNKRKPNFSGE